MATKRDEKTVGEAIRKAGGLKLHAARALGVSRPTLDGYLERWPSVRQEYEEANEVELDNSEAVLFTLRDGAESEAVRLNAARFHLATKGRARGYGDRQEVEFSGNSMAALVVSYPMPEDAPSDEERLRGLDELRKHA